MISIILIEPKRQENLGAIARSMKNFGFENLVLVNPKCKIGKSAIKVAKHGKSILDKVKIKDFSYLKRFDYLIGTSAILGTDYNIPRNAINAEQLADRLSNIKQKNSKSKLKIGILIGRESIGLKNQEINLCDILVSIPASKKYPTLNISHACSIVLYELFKKFNSENSTSNIKFATKKDKEIIMKYMNKALNKMEFSTKEKKET
ncbi:MAG: RNA methyltransferase, partial [Candidatus Woesearchaeota archaeon]|nr:RNA methyltransferase [Candidatus Woesearchaeota archaeon]